MATFLYKLKFISPVHFGADFPGVGLEKVSTTCHADTFFSAICQEFLALFEEAALNRLVNLAKEGNLLISDLMPFTDNNRLYLPRPAILPSMRSRNNNDEQDDATKRKKLKKTSFIPIDKWDDYLEFLQGNKEYEVEGDKPEEKYVMTRVAISRTGEDSEPYQVGSVFFKKGCGLYLLLKLEDKQTLDRFEKALKSLGLSGIGGKRTTGYGKFQLFEDRIELDPECYATKYDKKLAELLLNSKTAKYHMLLSVACPDTDELTNQLVENSFYTLIPRTGFVQSDSYYKRPVKRKPIVMFDTGSCFQRQFTGAVLDLSKEGNHPVYRYGKAMTMGVSLT